MSIGASSGSGQWWFLVPIEERAALAVPFNGVPLVTLQVPRRVVNYLRRSGLYADVADVMLAGEEILTVSGLGAVGLGEIDDALGPLFSGAAEDLEARRLSAGGDDLEGALHAIADLGDYQSGPWFELSLVKRAVLGRQFAHQPIGVLALSPQATSALLRWPIGGSVGSLLAAGDSIRSRTSIPTEVLVETHEALRAFCEAYSSAAEVRQHWLKALAALRTREDLVDFTLEEIGWPADLVVALPANDVADLVRLSDREAVELWDRIAVDRRLRESLVRETEVAAELPGVQDCERWARHWRGSGYAVLPEGFEVDGDMTIAAALTSLLRAAVTSRCSDIEWSILQHRHRLGGVTHFTLQDLGDMYGLTRERIRQLEQKAIAATTDWLDDPRKGLGSARVHPRLLLALAELEHLFVTVRKRPVRHSELVSRARLILEQPEGDVDPIALLLARARGLHLVRMSRKGLDPVWAYGDDAQLARIRFGISLLDRVLTRVSADPMTEDEIYAAIVAAFDRGAVGDRAASDGTTSDRPMTLGELRDYLRLCSSIERLPDGRYRVRFESLATRLLEIERVLSEAGVAMHISEIASAVNRDADERGRRRLRPANLGNRMSADDRFVPVGRSGYWALARWTDVETRTVVELMECCLAEHGEPMTPSQVFEWIAARRPVSEQSVVSYLTNDDRFARIDREHWGLPHWQVAQEATPWDRECVAEFVAGVFREHGTGVLEYALVRDALADAANVSKRAATGHLNANPVIETSEDSRGVLVAVFHDDYKTRLEQHRRRRRSTSRALARAEQISRDVLAKCPNHEMPLAELRDVLARELRVSSATTYSYVARLDCLETKPAPTGRSKIVRLVGSEVADTA
jgi:hypothetical protein